MRPPNRARRRLVLAMSASLAITFTLRTTSANAADELPDSSRPATSSAPVGLASPAAASGSASTSDSKLASLDGRWRRLQVDADEQIRLQAIEAAVEPLTWVVRKMAGGVLRSTTAPRSEIHFVWDGRKLVERVPGHRGVETRLVDPDAGTTKAIDSRGEPFEGDWRWTAEGLRFRWRQHQAYGENLYRIDAARHELTIDHAIHVTAIDGVNPILYRSHFARVDLPAVSSPGPEAPR